MLARWRILLVLVALTTGPAGATVPPVVLTEGQSRYVIGRQVEYLADTSFGLTFQAVRSRRFERSRQEVPNMVFSEADYWFRFPVRNDVRSPAKGWLFELGFGNIRRIELYLVDRQGRVQVQRAGDALGRTSRLFSFPTYVFRLPVPPGEVQEVYLHVSNRHLHNYFPLTIWERGAFQAYSQKVALLWGMYWGCLFLMFLYHFIIWLFTTDRNYFYLALYLLAYLFYETARGSNLGARYLWPDSPWFIERSLSLFAVGVIVSFTLFYSLVLNLRRAVPTMYWALRGLCVLGVVSFLNGIWPVLPLSTQLAAMLSSYPLVVIMFVAGLITWRQGQAASKFYLIAAMCYAVGFTVFLLNRTDVLPGMGLLLHYSQNLGSLFEFLFMSVGVADAIRRERRRRLAEEERGRELERASEEARLRQEKEREEALIEGQMQERRRVADELHDQLGSALFLLRVRLQELENPAENRQHDRTVYQSLLETVQDAYDGVRLIAHNFWPEELEKSGLGHALEQLIGSINRAGQTQFGLQLSGAEELLDRLTKFHLYCICLELANNILKHAQATEATIRFALGNDGRYFRLSVRDDGVGFDPDRASEGQGLSSIEERVRVLDGTVQFSSLPDGGGTWVQVRIPCALPVLVPALQPVA